MAWTQCDSDAFGEGGPRMLKCTFGKLSAKTPTLKASMSACSKLTIWPEGDELLALRGEPFLRVMPLLTGENGEHAVE